MFRQCPLVLSQREEFTIGNGYHGSQTDPAARHMFVIGPLNLNKRDKLATTIQQRELSIDEYQFDSLYMLATREDEPITFEYLYTEIWGDFLCRICGDEGLGQLNDCHYKRNTAKQALENLWLIVKRNGGGLMWIDHCNEKGYTFRTSWCLAL